jgi:hypothetical protein
LNQAWPRHWRVSPLSSFRLRQHCPAPSEAGPGPEGDVEVIRV